MMRILAEWATACAYGAVLIGMGLVTLMAGTVFLLLRLTGWLFGLPMRMVGGGRPANGRPE